MTEEKAKLKSFCRTCGGDRTHVVLEAITRSWSDDKTPVSGSDTWVIAECGGCETVSFVHQHSFSEDVERTEQGPSPVLYHNIYPQAPKRKMPEWAGTLLMDLPPDSLWIAGLHGHIPRELTQARAFSVARSTLMRANFLLLQPR